MSSSRFCTEKNSGMSLAPLMRLSYFPVCILPFTGSGVGFSGEGKHASLVGSSGCLPRGQRGISLEIITVFHPSSLEWGLN
jgi:hypothetical protein